MIAGIGIDLIETERVKEKIAKEKGFREYVFSEAEISYCEKQKNKFENYAARFAAKEALLKAFGYGLFGKLKLNEVEISSSDSGAPSFVFKGATKELISSRCSIGTKILVSLSHLQNIACAVVVIEHS
jgi:holo-[acyl-carrier protein] synthase